jgi:hypothetical protein
MPCTRTPPWAGHDHVLRGVTPVELPPAASDGETYLFTKDAAQAMGIAPCTVSQWKKKGYIKPVPGSPPRKPLYALSALQQAEQETRERAIAATKTDRRVQRKRGVL